MLSSLLIALLQFFIQPLFLVGLAYVFWANRHRVHYERTTFQSAIYRHFEEVKDYLLVGLLPGLILSVISIALGITVSLDWIFIYQLLTIFFLIFGTRMIHPAFTFSATAVLSWLFYNVFSDSYNQLPLSQDTLVDFSAKNFDMMGINWAIILFLMTFAGFILIKQKAYKLWTPYFMMSKRGVKVASYRVRELFVVPFLLLVPGDAFTALADWWPVFSIGNKRFAFFCLPILFGLHFTAQSHTPAEAGRKVNKGLLTSGIIAAISVVLGYFVNNLLIWLGFVLAFVVAIVTMIKHRNDERSHVVIYTPTDEGVRIVGIRPDTPADKLNIHVGDTILDVNGEAVSEASQVFQALEKNRSYVRLRLQRFDGEIILENSSLYVDDPYDLGFILLSQEEIL